MKQYSHDELTYIACRWLKNNRRCGLVFAEAGKGVCSEEPDALGFRLAGSESLLIECKTSRDDFFADFKKECRQNVGMGDFRWYLVPADLIALEEVPESWGLLYRKGNRVIEIKQPIKQETKDWQNELTWLYCATRRHQVGVDWQSSLYKFKSISHDRKRTG